MRLQACVRVRTYVRMHVVTCPLRLPIVNLEQIYNHTRYILTDRRYPSGNSMAISMCHPPVRLVEDQM